MSAWGVRTLGGLIRQLERARGDRLGELIGVAAALLNKHARHESYDWLTGEPQRLAEHSHYAEMERERPGSIEEYVRTEPERIRESFVRDLPASLLDVRLAEAEVRRLAAALVRLLDGRRGIRAASSAAYALSKFGFPDLSTVPAVTAFLRQCTPRTTGEIKDADDAWGAHQASITLHRLLEWVDRDEPVREDVRAVAIEACRALAHAAEVSGAYRPPAVRSYVPDPCEAAAQSLFWLGVRFGDRGETDGPQGEWEEMVRSGWAPKNSVLEWKVTAVERLGEDVVVMGEMANGTQPAVGRGVLVCVPGRQPVKAVLRGFRFNVERWRPEVALVLSGVSEDAFGEPAWVTTTLRLQHEGDFSEENLVRLEELASGEAAGRGESEREELLTILQDPMGEGNAEM